jgi:signal transduction histidine kinase
MHKFSKILTTIMLLICLENTGQKKSDTLFDNLSKVPLESLDKYLDKFIAEKDTLGMAYFYKIKAEKKSSQKNAKHEVVELSLKSMEYFEKTDVLQKNWIMLFLANQFTELYDGRLSLEYARNLADSVLKYADKVNHIHLKISALQTIFRLESSLESNSYELKKILSICDELYEKKVPFNLLQLQLYHYQKAFYDLGIKKFQTATQQFELARKYSIANNKKDFTLICTLFIAQIERLTNKNKNGLTILNAIPKDTLKEFPVLLMWSYQELALDYGKIGDLKNSNKFWELHFDQQVINTKNNLNNYRLGEMITTMFVKNEKLENEKLLLTNALSNEKNTNYRIYIIVLILMLFAFLAFFILRLKFHKLLDSSTKNEILLEGQELERSRFSKELHDGVGSSLAAIKTNLYFSEETPEKNNLLLLIDDLYNQVRGISHQLYPSYLINDGLTIVVKDYVHMINKEGKIDSQFFGTESNIESSKIINIFRIIQELLNNALRHAQATKIELEIMFDNNSILIRVQDDGKSFDSKADYEGIGLHNVKNRVTSMNGQIEFISEPNKGTTFMISFVNL